MEKPVTGLYRATAMTLVYPAERGRYTVLCGACGQVLAEDLPYTPAEALAVGHEARFHAEGIGSGTRTRWAPSGVPRGS